jgi:hypothetical protein
MGGGGRGEGEGGGDCLQFYLFLKSSPAASVAGDAYSDSGDRNMCDFADRWYDKVSNKRKR